MLTTSDIGVWDSIGTDANSSTTRLEFRNGLGAWGVLLQRLNQLQLQRSVPTLTVNPLVQEVIRNEGLRTSVIVICLSYELLRATRTVGA